MRKTIFLAAILLLAAQATWAKEKGYVGGGVILGDPIGGTIKAWASREIAFDAGVGFSGDTAMWADVLWHAWDLLPKPKSGDLALYLGAGPRIETAADTQFGLRTIVGTSYWFPKHPLELFAEVGPVFRFTQGGHVDADGGVGVRLYFGGKK